MSLNVRGRGTAKLQQFGPGTPHVLMLFELLENLPDSERVDLGGGHHRKDPKLLHWRSHLENLVCQQHQSGLIIARQRAASYAGPLTMYAKTSGRIAKQDFEDAALAMMALPLDTKLFHYNAVSALCTGVAWRCKDDWTLSASKLGY